MARRLVERMVGRGTAVSCADICVDAPFSKPLAMKGGTAFHFVTDGIHSAFERAKDAAKDRDVRIGGGVVTIQQYLRARLIDELHLAVRPMLWDRARIYSQVSKCARSAILARNMFPVLTRCI